MKTSLSELKRELKRFLLLGVIFMHKNGLEKLRLHNGEIV